MLRNCEMTSSQAKLAVEEGVPGKRRSPKVVTRNLVVIVVVLALVTVSLLVATVVIASDREHLSSRLRSANQVAPCPQPKECLTPTCVKAAAALIESMNTEVNPCDNFFEFSCGGWSKKHVIPEYRSSFSSFSVLREQLQVTLKGLFEADISPTDIEAEIKVKHFYQACIDVDTIEQVDDAPLRDLLHKLGGWPVLGDRHGGRWNETAFDFEWLLATLASKYSKYMLIEPYVGVDDKNASRYVLQIDQSGLGLSSREYFLDTVKHGKIQDAYLKLMTSVAVLLGANLNDAKRDMKETMDFETKLANITVPPADRRDNELLYNPTTLNGLIADYPRIDWPRFFDILLPNVSKPIANDEFIINKEPEYITQVIQLIRETSNKTLANYMLWRVTQSRILNLGKKFQDVNDDFRAVLYGVTSDDARWRRCVDDINGAMIFATGRMYVRENFAGESKNNTLRMIKYLKRAFKEMLKVNEWMDEQTKQVAAEKCDAMQELVGYPDWLFDDQRLNDEYKTLNFSRDDYFGNIVRYLEWSAHDNLKKLREEVDRDGWLIGPAVVNAYYRSNQIVFPAAILQPPFYHADLPWYLNFGGIGMVIGHEITHGFDDRGRQYDKDGNLVQWWSNSSIAAFKDRAQCIVDQYTGYVMPENDMNLNGKMTQGENIADNGGLKEAFKAYQLLLNDTGEVHQTLPGLDLNQEQLFFLNFGQVWCSAFRPEGVRARILSGVHSPGRYRTIGPAQNMPDFARVFGCKNTDYMVSNNTCTIW
ncbi:neprilysin-1-like [Diadema setosum]|uniref:neprilysin-1-like n=1 Tax=Diadema setosum TaxID=31175 RepID=UPI003B3A6121